MTVWFQMAHSWQRRFAAVIAVLLAGVLFQSCHHRQPAVEIETPPNESLRDRVLIERGAPALYLYNEGKPLDGEDPAVRSVLKDLPAGLAERVRRVDFYFFARGGAGSSFGAFSSEELAVYYDAKDRVLHSRVRRHR